MRRFRYFCSQVVSLPYEVVSVSDEHFEGTLSLFLDCLDGMKTLSLDNTFLKCHFHQMGEKISFERFLFGEGNK